MGRNKLKKFAENESFPNFFQPTQEEIEKGALELKGKWGDRFFMNTNPITVELGCGRGEYTVGLAERCAAMNFIGIDKKGARMWTGCKESIEKKMPNVAFLRIQIDYITQCFDKDEVAEIWITFPDPQPRQIKTNKRLTSPRFLQYYKQIIKPDGFIHLKTDNPALYAYTLDVIAESNHRLVEHYTDIHASAQQPPDAALQIETYYERKWREQALPIHYIKFQLN